MQPLPSFIRFPHWYRNNAQIQNSEAERGFEILGTNAQQTVTALMEVYEQNISPSSQIYAGGTLSVIAVAVPSTVPSFLRWAANTNQSVRLLAVSVLSLGRHEPSLVVPALSKCLSDTNNDVRTLAAQGLGWYGTEARQAVPALVPLLNDPYRLARVTATNALNAIDPEAAAKAGVK
jgi:HEAT repeat protein